MTRLARPLSIIWFERLFFASVALRPIYLVVRWEELTYRVAAIGGISEGIIGAAATASVLIPALLGWYTARRASRIGAFFVLTWILATALVYATDVIPVGLHWGY